MRHDFDPDPHPLRRYRQKRGLTLMALAARANTTHSSVLQLERGNVAQPTYDLIRRLSAATGGEVRETEILLWHHRRARRAIAVAA